MAWDYIWYMEVRHWNTWKEKGSLGRVACAAELRVWRRTYNHRWLNERHDEPNVAI
jgi:hypothetical protein